MILDIFFKKIHFSFLFPENFDKNCVGFRHLHIFNPTYFLVFVFQNQYLSTIPKSDIGQIFFL